LRDRRGHSCATLASQSRSARYPKRNLLAPDWLLLLLLLLLLLTYQACNQRVGAQQQAEKQLPPSSSSLAITTAVKLQCLPTYLCIAC
jgi:hypothetical protein